MLSQPEHVFVVKADLAPSNSKHCGGLLTPYHKHSSLLNSIGEHTSLFWSKKKCIILIFQVVVIIWIPFQVQEMFPKVMTQIESISTSDGSYCQL